MMKSTIITLLMIGGVSYVLMKKGAGFSLVDGMGNSLPDEDWDSLFASEDVLQYFSSGAGESIKAGADVTPVITTFKNVLENISDAISPAVVSISNVIQEVTTGETETMRNEGLRLNIYKDSKGYDTIGYGHKLTSDDKVTGRYKNGITKEKAIAIYNQDHAKAEGSLYRALPWVRQQPAQVQEALIDMTFNMGIGNGRNGHGLLSFKNTLAYIQNGDYKRASQGILNSKYARDVGSRANRNAEKIRTA